MNRYGVLAGAILVLGAIAYGLGHFLDGKGIRSEEAAKIAAQEQVEKRELAPAPPQR